MKALLLFAFACLPLAANAQFLINEVNADQPGGDTAEFVELRGAANASLDGHILVFFNGSATNDASYRTYDLTGQTTGADGLFVLCGNAANVAGCDLDVTPDTDLIQNGQDAIGLYNAPAASFPNGTAPTSTDLVDALVYGTNDGRDAALLAALGQAVQFDEGLTGLTSSQRLNFPTASSGLFYQFIATPGAPNPTALTVDATAGVSAGAGWRMLSLPVIKPPAVPYQVGDLAAINLIQGVPAGSTNGPQYPTSVDNLYVGYVGGGTFGTVSSTDSQVGPGLGVLWYWYDSDFDPNATPDPNNPGTSRSYALNNPSFQLSLTGIPIDDQLLGSPIQVTYPVRNTDGFYFIGNPYAYPLRLGGGTVSTGTLSSVFSVYNGATGSYEILIADFADPFAGAALPVWNGVMAQVTDAATAPTFTISSDFVDPTMSPAFIGRPATGRVALSMTGTLSDGTVVNDEAAMVRFVDDALVTWDLHDGSKLMPPPGAFGLIAPVGVGPDGAALRQSVRSLPTTLAEALTMPVAFTASAEGTFTLSWNMAGYQGTGSVLLRDLVTGAITDLTTATSYTFTSGAATWTDRFELSFGTGVVSTDGPVTAALEVGLPSPNPTASNAVVSVRTASADVLLVEVLDALGRTVLTPFHAPVASGSDVQVTIATGDLAPGTYLVRVVNGSSRKAQRLTVLR